MGRRKNKQPQKEAKVVTRVATSLLAEAHVSSSRVDFSRLGRLRLPGCVVFDLDDTLWEGDVDCTAGPPFTFLAGGAGGRAEISDSAGGRLRLLPDAVDVLTWVDRHPDLKMAVASRTTAPPWGEKALQVAHTHDDRYLSVAFHAKEMYPRNKVNHLRQIAAKTKVLCEDMVFYDNEHYNMEAAEQVGALPVYTPRGLNWDNFIKGLERYHDRLVQREEAEGSTTEDD